MDCRDAMSRNEAMAEGLQWRQVRIGPMPGQEPVQQSGKEADGPDNAAFVSGLFELGRAAGAQWLHQHFKDIGVRATVDMSLAPDQRVGRRPQAKPPKPARRTAAP